VLVTNDMVSVMALLVTNDMVSVMAPNGLNVPFLRLKL
jgi:hypothetical protein